MSERVAARVGSRDVILVDSITEIGPGDAGHIVVSGSHGGRSAGQYALAAPLALCCFNDAGVGKEGAGIVALEMLAARGIAAVAVSHDSARIGEADQTWATGVIAHVNSPAARLGLAAGEPLRDAVLRVFGV